MKYLLLDVFQRVKESQKLNSSRVIPFNLMVNKLSNVLMCKFDLNSLYKSI